MAGGVAISLGNPGSRAWRTAAGREQFPGRWEYHAPVSGDRAPASASRRVRSGPRAGRLDHARELKNGGGAAALAIVEGERASVELCEPARDRQPEAGAFVAGRHERLEQVLANLRRNARPTVENGHVTVPIVHRRVHVDGSRSARLGRIQQEIEHDRANHLRIEIDDGVLAGDLDDAARRGGARGSGRVAKQ